MDIESLVDRVSEKAHIDRDLAKKAIYSTWTAIGCSLHVQPPPPPGACKFPKELIRPISDGAGISIPAAGITLALVLEQIVHLAQQEGVRTTFFEYRP